MYGILVESVRDAIINHYGHEIWDQIQEHLNIQGSEILANNIYPDVLFPQVTEALVFFRQCGDHNSYMEFFGHTFVGFFSNYGFEKILKIAGRTYSHFLHSIDQLHDSNRFTFPKMKSPLFYVDGEDEKGLCLHYHSKRRGFNWYVIGQLKECARRFFNMKIEINISKDISDDNFNHVIYRVDFENTRFTEEITKSLNEALVFHKMTSIGSQTLIRMFPFSVGFDTELNIQYASPIYMALFNQVILDKRLTDVFTILRPRVPITWDSIMLLKGCIIFEMESLLEVNKEQNVKKSKLKLKGQMKFLDELNLVFFLGHPMLGSLEEMIMIGLHINDMSKFDSTPETLVTDVENTSQLQQAFETQHAWTSNLESTKAKLNAWRKKSKKLLYSMLPPRIALQIENGVKPNTICETFEQVTIMFVNTADFSMIVNNTEPAEIIKFINSTISVYDGIVQGFDKIQKIETKADGSYMVVAGLDDDKPGLSDSNMGRPSMMSLRSVGTADDDEVPKKSFPLYNQAERICAVALELLNGSHDLHNPFEDKDSDDHLKIKIGFHTGSIVAGIVGMSTIQFCLFGDTVNTASRMASNSLAGKICFSSDSFKLLENSNFFEWAPRESIQVKGKGAMKTYWLIGKKNSFGDI